MKDLVSSLDLFEERIEEVNSFLDHFKSNTLNDLSDRANTEGQREFLKYFKSFNGTTIHYNAIIISLYGCFENYVNTVFSCYLNIVFSNIASYEQLPLNIKRKYQTKVGEYLINPQHFNGWDVPIPRIIDNFSKVLTSTYSSLEDKEFLLMHPGNLKSTQLFNFLNEMGIQNGKDKFLESPLIKDFFVNILGFEESDYDLKVSRNHPDLFIYLDTLVEQRNFVAHGRVDEPRISSNELKEKYVPFLKILARVITRILMCELYVMIFAKKSSFSQRFPLDVFSNNIIGIHIGNETIKKGDYVIFGTEKDVKCARVLNIKIGEQDKEKITDIDCDIGLKTDQKINQNHLIFYIVPC